MDYPEEKVDKQELLYAKKYQDKKFLKDMHRSGLMSNKELARSLAAVDKRYKMQGLTEE